MRVIDCSKHNLKEIEDPDYFVQISEQAKEALYHGYDILQDDWNCTYDHLKSLIILSGISSLEELRRTTTLDLGCGQNNGIDSWMLIDTCFEPWLCRALHLLGAKAIGIDIGNLSTEKFEHHKRDLLDEAPLEEIAEGSIDIVYTSGFFNSPHLHKKYKKNILPLLELNLLPEIRRVLKPNGVFLHYGAEECASNYPEGPDLSCCYGQRLDALISQAFPN